jgi:hypothetical protein
MKSVSFMGIALLLLVAVNSIAEEVPTVQVTADGGLYLVGPTRWGGQLLSVNGCTNISIPRFADVTIWDAAKGVWRSENLRNFFSTGTTVLGSGGDRLSVSNDRDIKIGEIKVVTLTSGAREVQVPYELPVLAGQNLGWTFRRPDHSFVSSAGWPAYKFSFELKAVAHIPIPLALNGGGTMDFDTRPEPMYYYEFCPGAQDETTATVFIEPVKAPTPPQSLRGIVLTDPLPIFEQRVVSGTVSVKVPLGSRFALTVLGGSILGAPSVTSNRERVSSNVTSPLAKRKIFEDDAIIAIGGAFGTSHDFIATHLGTATWKLTPANGESITVTVNVMSPARLGGTENKWDKSIVSVAHKTGILPQFVKGQMAQESPNGKNFDALAYRYEPCGADLNYISSNLQASAGGPKIGNAPYVHYRAPDPRGSELHDDDLSPRDKYWLGLPTDSSRRKLGNADVNITARQIWDGNNIHSKTGPPKGQRWDKFCKPSTLKAINEDGSTILDFVAQTPTAASYGLFQMMYDTAVSGWEGALVNGTRVKAPRYLFDTDANIAIDGGTMTIANMFMAKNFIKTQETSTFSTYTDFENWARLAYVEYNRYHPTYPAGVIGHSYEFLPVSASGMF